jgi:hypothetical protein
VSGTRLTGAWYDLRALRSLALASLLVLGSCTADPAPPTRETVILKGSAYERGLQHGQQLSSKIKSFYTTLLTSSLFPYLGREQPDIATLLKNYNDPRYQDGQFAYQLLLESAKSLEHSLPLAARDELRGISDGSGLSYDQVLVLNTFVDSTLAVRGIALAIRLSRAPVLERIEFVGLDTDGADNDDDGLVDEPGEGVLSPYSPPRGATFVEIPPHTTVKVQLRDPDGVDPSLVRVQLGAQLLDTQKTSQADGGLEVTAVVDATPAAASLLVVSAGDTKILHEPAPDHASFMRDTEILFTTKGTGLKPLDVRWPVLDDKRTRPPSVALSLAGPATQGGAPFIAQNFALLDASTAHKHTVLFVHEPPTGPKFAVVGWAGVAWGFSGMNDRGVGYACNPSDTLDNSVVGSVFEQVADLDHAKLVAAGTPLGFAMRRVLETSTSVDAGVTTVGTFKHPYGWACALGDSAGGQRVVEVDSDIFKEGSSGIYEYGTADHLSSNGDGDLVIGSDYAKNQDDISRFNIAGQKVVPQREWTGLYFRSRRATSYLLNQVKAKYGALDVASVEALMADPTVVDASDSMNSVVLDLKGRKVYSAMGQEPATAGPFEMFDLGAQQ